MLRVTSSPAIRDRRPAALVLAAGESTRMGRPKPLLPWRGVTLIEWQVRQIVAAGAEPVVVLGHRAEEVRPRVPKGALVVVNEAYREGRASSLRAGARALADDTPAVLVLNVDQPRPADLLRTLLDEHERAGARITVPVHGGRRGHPPVLAGALLEDLREATEEEQGLRGVLAAHENDVREVEVDRPIVHLDLNTPQEYERAFAEYGRSTEG